MAIAFIPWLGRYTTWQVYEKNRAKRDLHTAVNISSRTEMVTQLFQYTPQLTRSCPSD